jgi:hypothetical protein
MFDPSMLMKLLSADPSQVGNLASMAAMKAPPPVIGPNNPGTLAPGAFAGILDPNVGAVPPGIQNPMMAMPQAQPQAPAVPPGMPLGLDANQAGILSQLGQQQPLHFPGASLAPRPGQIQTAQMGLPQVNAQRPSLAQLLGG